MGAKQGHAVAKNPRAVAKNSELVNSLYTPLGLPVFGEQKRLSTYWSARAAQTEKGTPFEVPLVPVNVSFADPLNTP